MKKSWIKKKSKLKRKSKSETRKIQDLLWLECKRIIRARYSKDGKYFCYTCDKEIAGSSCQTGHFIPNSVGGCQLRYNLDNLRLQCYRCNIDLSGNGAEFYRRLVQNEGQEFVDKLFRIKNSTYQQKSIDLYKQLLVEYKLILA